MNSGSCRHSHSLRHFAPYNGPSLIKDRIQTRRATRPRHGQRRETDRAPGNVIRVPPDDAARPESPLSRLPRTSDRLPLRSCAYRGARESCSGRAFSAYLRHRWGPLGICNSFEGRGRKYIRCRTKNATSTLKAPVGSSAKVALVFVQSQRPVYARIGLTPGRQRQKLPPV